MLESGAWSEPQSDVTEELGLATSAGNGGAAVTLNPLRFCQHFANGDAALRQRCVMPKAQPSSLNRSDQRVPEYWDQLVPVWEGGGAASAATKRKASASRLQDRDSRRFGGGGAKYSASDTASSGDYCACSTGCDGGSWRGGGGGDGGARGSSSEVSFDAILSMYESSLGEKSLRRDGWVLGATLLTPRHNSFRRRRTFAGRGPISVPLSASRALTGEAGVDYNEAETVRRLRVAIERTTIADAASVPCGPGSVRLRIADPIVHRSCDFQSSHLRPLAPGSFEFHHRDAHHELLVRGAIETFSAMLTHTDLVTFR